MAEEKLRFDMLLPPEMSETAVAAGLKKVQMDFLSTMLLGILAGIFIGLAANFYTVTITGAGDLPFGICKLLGGLTFCLGLILVIIAGAELFTGNNLIVMAVASGKVSVRWLIRNWVIVYCGNLIGSLGLAWLICQTGQERFANGEVGRVAMRIAEAKCTLSFWPAFCLGILCNALVCLAVWLCFSAHSTTDRILAIIFPITAFVACGFEHSVANMYFIPAGMLIKSITQAGGFENITWYNFVVKNLVPVTLGNIFSGAVMVGLVFWVIYCRRTPRYREKMK